MILEMELLLVYALSVIFMLIIQSALTTRQHGPEPLVGNREDLSLAWQGDPTGR
jgi:hypothetical protein